MSGGAIHIASAEVATWFERLGRKLAATGLDSGTVYREGDGDTGYRVGVDPGEFMLMGVTTGRAGFHVAQFKHTGSRNYLWLHWIDARDDGRIEVPIGGAFYGGTFPKVGA